NITHLERNRRVAHQLQHGLSDETAASATYIPRGNAIKSDFRRWRRRSNGFTSLPELLQTLRRNADNLGNPGQHQLAIHPLRELGPQWACVLRETRPAVCMSQIGLLRELLDEIFGQRQCLLEPSLKRLLPFL